MSSFERRRLLRAAALVAVGVTLGGCGFRPLYAPPDSAETPSVLERLAQINVAPLPDRTGQQMHNLLRDELNPLGQPARPRYDLVVSLKVETEDLGIREDATATRANLSVTAIYILRDSATGEALLRGRSRSTNSYNFLSTEVEYATVVSEKDAEERALRQVSEDIRTRLAVFFSDNGEI